MKTSWFGGQQGSVGLLGLGGHCSVLRTSGSVIDGCQCSGHMQAILQVDNGWDFQMYHHLCERLHIICFLFISNIQLHDQKS